MTAAALVRQRGLGVFLNPYACPRASNSPPGARWKRELGSWLWDGLCEEKSPTRFRVYQPKGPHPGRGQGTLG